MVLLFIHYQTNYEIYQIHEIHLIVIVFIIFLFFIPYLHLHFHLIQYFSYYLLTSLLKCFLEIMELLQSLNLLL